MENELADHYRRRAPKYESVYFRPDETRLLELEDLARDLRDWLRGRDVLEIAAGTGWYTVHAAATAKSIVATDVNEEPLEIAKTKPLEQVRFEIADAFHLEEVKGRFDGALACFWLSHVSRSRLPAFLGGLHRRLEPGSRVFMADNMFEEGVGGRFHREEGSPDTYRFRKNDSGGEDKVLKNYYSEEELRSLLAGTSNLRIVMRQKYWWIMYETAA